MRVMDHMNSLTDKYATLSSSMDHMNSLADKYATLSSSINLSLSLSLAKDLRPNFFITKKARKKKSSWLFTP